MNIVLHHRELPEKGDLPEDLLGKIAVAEEIVNLLDNYFSPGDEVGGKENLALGTLTYFLTNLIGVKHTLDGKVLLIKEALVRPVFRLIRP